MHSVKSGSSIPKAIFAAVLLLLFFRVPFLPAQNVQCNHVSLPALHPAGLFAAQLRARYPEAINVEDIDSDGQLEVVAWATDGIHVWHYDKSRFTWRESNVSHILTGPPWDLPLHHRSIRLVRVKGDPYPELLARGPDEVHAYQYNPKSETWLRSYSTDPKTLDALLKQAMNKPRIPPLTATPFPAFSGAQLTAYNYISEQLLVNAPNASIRSQYSNLALEQEFASAYPSTMNNLQSPAGIDSSDWTVVTTQLNTEFKYVAAVDNWFTLLGNLYSNQGIANIISAVTVANVLSIPNPSSNSTAILLDLGGLISSIVANISGLGDIPGLGVIAGLVNTAFTAAQDAETGGGPNITAQVATIDTNLGVFFNNSITANGCQQQAYTTDWGLLQSLGQPIAQGTYTWNAELTGEILSASKTTYASSLYQTLTPVIWEILQRCSNPSPGYTCDNPGYKYEYFTNNHYLFIGLHGYGVNTPPIQAQNALFQSPSQGGLGASVPTVMLSQGGWRMPFGGVCSPLPPSQREHALAEVDELRGYLHSLGDGDRDGDDTLQEYLRKPLDGATYALKQARNTKGSTLPTIAAYYIESFATRSGIVSGRLGGTRSAQLQHEVKLLRRLLLPTTQASARTRNRISYSRKMWLDGSDSASVDGVLPTYFWKSTGPEAKIRYPHTATPQVMFISGPGSYTFELTVTDGFGDISKDTVAIRYKGR